MRKFTYFKFIFILALLFTTKTAFSESKIWNIDPSHTKIQFTVPHMVISSVTGDFTSFGGKVISNDNDFTDASMNISINVLGLDTGNAKRDNHLRSEHFFNVKKYPYIKFKSTSIKKIDDKNFKVVGDFTIHGITKSEELNMFYGGTIRDPFGNDRSAFKITGSIDRFNYDLKWNELLETGGAMVGKTVDILSTIEIIHKPGKAHRN